jgi:ABC-type phosphate transport system permease subunit
MNLARIIGATAPVIFLIAAVVLTVAITRSNRSKP